MTARITMFALVMLSLVTYAVSPNHKTTVAQNHVACCNGDPMCNPVHGCTPNGDIR